MNLAIVGYGKMGRLIEQLAPEYGCSVKLRLDVDNNANFEGLTTEQLRGIDAAVEFSTPAAAPENIERLARLGVNAVIGTTGWFDQMERARAAVERAVAFGQASDERDVLVDEIDTALRGVEDLRGLLAELMGSVDGETITWLEHQDDGRRETTASIRERWRRLVEDMPGGFAEIAEDGTLLVVSENLANLLERPKQPYLHGWGYIANLIQEDGSAFAFFK